MREALFLKALRVTLSGLSAGGKSANVPVDHLHGEAEVYPKEDSRKRKVSLPCNAFHDDKKRNRVMKQLLVIGSLGVAMVAFGLGVAPSSHAQGLMDSLTGLLGGQDQTATAEPTTSPLPSPPGESSSMGDEEALTETTTSGSVSDTGMAGTSDVETPEVSMGQAQTSPQQGMSPGEFPTMPLQLGF